MADSGRVLFVVPPLTGHINPTRGLGAALLARGHAVAWCGYAGKLGDLPPGGQLLALPEDGDPELVAGLMERGLQLRGLRSVKFFHEEFLLPLADAMVGGVAAAIDAFAPDLVVVDQQALAGALVARKRGLRWLTSCTTSAGMLDPGELLPGIGSWHAQLLGDFQRRHGVEPVARPGDSDAGVLVFSSERLVGRSYGPSVHFVGPALGARPDVAFPWDALAPGRRVLVSLGTVSFARGASFYAAVVDGLGGLDLQVILVAPASLVPSLPPNFLRRDFVPQVALLPHVDAVVSHGGHNTVVETLSAGRPLVLAPIRDDQPAVAAQVVAAGAGVRVRFGRVKGPTLRDAVLSVLDDPSYRTAAAAIATSFAEAGGVERAADVVESHL